VSQSEIPVTRRDKTLDYKALILEYALETDSEKKTILSLKLSSTPGGNARPDDILQLLEIDPADCAIERVGLNFSTQED